MAEGRAPSVSAYAAQALARRSADEELVEMLARMDAEQGARTAQDYEWAQRALGLRA